MTQLIESTVFEVIPYVGTNSVAFGMNPLQVKEILGQSNEKLKNHQGKLVEFWSYMNVCYSERGVVEHIGFGRQMKNIILNDVNLFYSDSSAVLKKLLTMDFDPMEYHGFLIFLKLGISLTGFHDDVEDDKAAALFMRGAWDLRKSKMKKFKLA